MHERYFAGLVEQKLASIAATHEQATALEEWQPALDPGLTQAQAAGQRHLFETEARALERVAKAAVAAAAKLREVK